MKELELTWQDRFYIDTKADISSQNMLKIWSEYYPYNNKIHICLEDDNRPRPIFMRLRKGSHYYFFSKNIKVFTPNKNFEGFAVLKVTQEVFPRDRMPLFPIEKDEKENKFVKIYDLDYAKEENSKAKKALN